MSLTGAVLYEAAHSVFIKERKMTIDSTNDLKEITSDASQIKALAPMATDKGVGSQRSLDLGIETECEVNGIGMGVLDDGTPFLNQRGLAALCGVENAHIGYISSQWNDTPQKPRIESLKKILSESGMYAEKPHIEIMHRGRVNYCYPAQICLAILEYYAFHAGSNCQPEAKSNFRLLAGSQLQEMIYSNVGYDPYGTNNDRFAKWHERIMLNHQSAPKGYFSIFNEAHTIIYEMIQAGADVGEKTVVDISIGLHWGQYWDKQKLEMKYGERVKYPHRYPESHPQAKSNPQTAWCYPLSALGVYREWLQDVYIENGKFANYLKNKVKSNQLPPSIAELAIAAVGNRVIEASV